MILKKLLREIDFDDFCVMVVRKSCFKTREITFTYGKQKQNSFDSF